MTDIDNAIQRVEQLYRNLTGRDAPSADAPYAPIPPERDPVDYVDSQLDRLLMALGPLPSMPRPMPWAPPVTLSESPTELCVALDLPGVARDEIDVSVIGHQLLVTGRRRPEREGGDWRVTGSERPFGRFRRVVPLPDGAAVDRLTAEMKSGVLEIRVPRATPRTQEPVVVTVQ